ncbi:hypothetical protein HYS00_02955 [Candidatus Microgenomates bacterium]|nr:hypothetical protein [Candidatus Microgenomates bacterium]
MAKKLANEFIALEPFTTIEECRDKIEQFVEKFPRFDNLKLYINNYLEEQKVNSVIERMKKHIKDNDIDKALEVANLSS